MSAIFVPLQSVKFMIIASQHCIVLAFFGLFCEFSMDSAPKSEENEIEKLSGKVPAL